ncbi:hypothetical protein TNCV_2763891 [Trichonephila clavipes]|nr:hypothetical protein TNCV_2763891 [Trichonephila clavipes]
MEGAEDYECSGRPQTSRNTENIGKISAVVRILDELEGSLLDVVTADSGKETDGLISVDSAVNLLDVVGDRLV